MLNSSVFRIFDLFKKAKKIQDIFYHVSNVSLALA